MRNTTIKGFLYAALSSSTFGLAPFFSISLLIAGFSSFEVLTYRWGIASLILAIAGINWESSSESAEKTGRPYSY